MRPMLITDIQRFSVNDGPGIRTTVFLKGCPLSCFWCHNPETQSSVPELMYYPSRCIGCGSCAAACPTGSLRFTGEDGDRRRIYNAGLCRSSGDCAAACPSGALTLAGRPLYAGELLALAEADRPYFDASGGGVTFSGGEPLMQPEALLESMRLLHGKGFRLALDTSGQAPYTSLQPLLDYTDLILYDVKCMDPMEHLRATGEDNRQILDNLKRLSAIRDRVIIRVPVIPGFNDTEEEIGKIAYAVSRHGYRRLDLLPFHSYASSKYAALGREYPAAGLVPPDDGRMECLAAAARAYVPDVRVERH